MIAIVVAALIASIGDASILRAARQLSTTRVKTQIPAGGGTFYARSFHDPLGFGQPQSAAASIAPKRIASMTVPKINVVDAAGGEVKKAHQIVSNSKLDYSFDKIIFGYAILLSMWGFWEVSQLQKPKDGDATDVDEKWRRLENEYHAVTSHDGIRIPGKPTQVAAPTPADDDVPPHVVFI